MRMVRLFLFSLRPCKRSSNVEILFFTTAINGLDDLRGWTLKGVIQPFVKVYVVRTPLLYLRYLACRSDLWFSCSSFRQRTRYPKLPNRGPTWLNLAKLPAEGTFPHL